jgi:hypothetical protein
MISYRNRHAALDLRASAHSTGEPAPRQVPSEPAKRHARARPWDSFLQPFLMRLHRHDEHVIVYVLGHPEYEAFEAMVTRRPGKSPLIRAILSKRGGVQIDHINEADAVQSVAAALTQRRAIYRPIEYSSAIVDGIPEVHLRFKSYRDEDIDVHFKGKTGLQPGTGKLIDPGTHASSSSLPLMVTRESAFASDKSTVTINGASYAVGSQAPPYFFAGVHSRDFRIGVVRAGHLELERISTPRRLEPGERWVYQDGLGNHHVYEILTAGEVLTLRKPAVTAFPEERIEAIAADGGIALRSVQVYCRDGDDESALDDASGLRLALTPEGTFTVSLDQHPDVVTGVARLEETGTTTAWTLEPVAPRWTSHRRVQSTVTRADEGATLHSTVGEV